MPVDLKEYRKALQRRVERWRAFLDPARRGQAGDLMVYIYWARGASLEGFLTGQFRDLGPEAVLRPRTVKKLIAEYVGHLRGSYDQVIRFDDDVVPSALVYWGIGSITAAMVGPAGGEPMHDGFTSWLEPNLEWEQIEHLRFDPDNKWVRFAVRVNQALWELWEEDFHVLPYLHRSPLDAANGIRGTSLFAEMYSDPDRVHRLIDWCADWQLAMERHIAAQRPRPRGWGNAVWGTWLPDDAIFVNGDPVGLISRRLALEFEQPYTAKLFTGTGGGFFHNHTVGLRQADLVSSTPGTLVQFFVNDPKQPSGPEALLEHPDLREKLLAASLQAPIGIAGVSVDKLKAVLDVVRHGRFILAIDADPQADSQAGNALVRQVRAVSGLD